MKELPLISCILPVYNGERYLREALDSVLAQVHRPNEIIVVDDGSTDGSADIVRSYGDQIRLVKQANSGPAAARNRGLKEANGELITFQDADDIWHKEKLVRQLAWFDSRPELDLCVTHIKNFWGPECAHKEALFRGHKLSKVLPGYGCPTVMVRRKVFDRVGMFDESLQLAEDTDWFARVRDAGCVIEVLPDLLVHRRMHDRNISYKMYEEDGRQVQLDLVIASLKRRRAQSGDE